MSQNLALTDSEIALIKLALGAYRSNSPYLSKPREEKVQTLLDKLNAIAATIPTGEVYQQRLVTLRSATWELVDALGVERSINQIETLTKAVNTEWFIQEQFDQGKSVLMRQKDQETLERWSFPNDQLEISIQSESSS